MFAPSKEFNQQTISQQLALGIAALEAGQTRIEFNQTKDVDSSAVACMLAWKRHAQQHGIKLEFGQVPANLVNLIELYGVEEFL